MSLLTARLGLPPPRSLAPLARRPAAVLARVVVLWSARFLALPALEAAEQSLPRGAGVVPSTSRARRALSLAGPRLALAALLAPTAALLPATVGHLPAGLALVLPPPSRLLDAATGATAGPPLLAERVLAARGIRVVAARRLGVTTLRALEGFLAAPARGVRPVVALAAVDGTRLATGALALLNLSAVVVPALAVHGLVLGSLRAFGDRHVVTAVLFVTPAV